MQLMPMGDYYVWYCEWCDSRNMTLWTRIDAKEVACGCCHRTFPLSTNAVAKVIADFTTTLATPAI
ncbi:hypothetical protein [Geotalea toluenoxydans]|uniref:hypothetical protein n=1 Tax=Geotalea toluenoxydans TaxID=421624 RepID=UPI0006CF2B60|nr:hypothetical protein [Geotalea toluenoxydans]